MGILKSHFGLQVIENTIPRWVFIEKLKFEGLYTKERHENDLIMSQNLLIIFLDILLQWLAFSWTSNDQIVWSVAHNLTKFLVYKPSQLHRIQTLPSCCLLKNVYNGSEILFALWTIICYSNLTRYVQPNLHCFSVKASILYLQQYLRFWIM